ncbi:MAG TPA: ABC transporter permease [Vicinamibacterales bacterium]|nr:ABC transporter permease [Vicinamibacterales bacterium]
MNVLRDVRYGLRILARNPSYAAAALAVLALGIGASTAVFTVVRAVLIQPLPYREPNRLVLFRADAPGYDRYPGITGNEFFALRDRGDLFEDVAAINGVNANLTDGDEMERVAGGSATDNFLPLLGVAPAAGRPLSSGLDMGREYVRSVVISYELWQRRWQGDPSTVGRHISVNNIDVEVVGITPAGFRTFLGTDANVSPRVDIWFVNVIARTDRYRGPAVARLRPSVSVAAAQQAVDRLVPGPVHLTLVPLADDVAHDVRPALVAFSGAVAFVLLVACANLTNLLLARGCTRTRELAIRTAVGASRSQLVRQLAVESIVLAAIGGAAGLLVGQWAVDGLLALAPPGLPRRESIEIGVQVALFAFGAALASALVFGLVPAWQATRAELSAMMKPDAAAARGSVIRGLLVASQLAFSMLLLVGAGLMARTFINMRQVNLGFNPSAVLTLKLELSFRRFDTPAKRFAFYQQARDAVRSVPGVREVGLGTPVPLDGLPLYQRLAIQERGPEADVSQHVVFSGYFNTMRIPLRAGRDFGPEDDAPAGGQPHVIVDQRLADQLWPGGNPIGQRVQRVLGQPARAWAEVIGVVDHVQTADLHQKGLPQIYESFGERGYGAAFIIRTDGDPVAVAGPVKAAIERLGPGRPVFAIRTLDSLVADASADTRFALFVLTVFAVTAVALTAIGVYGVVAYATARRTREIAVRLALGADARGIVTLVVRDGAAWTVSGVAAGLAGALALSRYLATLLFNVGARDPSTFAAVAALLALVALIATALPAIRAVRVDPMVALRSE